MAYIADLDWQRDRPDLAHRFDCMCCGFLGTLEDCRRLGGAYLCPVCGLREDSDGE